MYFLRSASISGFIASILLWEDYSIETLCRGTLSTRFGHCFLVHFFEGYAFVVVIEFQELHFVITFRTIQRVITKREKNSGSPLCKAAVYSVFFF